MFQVNDVCYHRKYGVCTATEVYQENKGNGADDYITLVALFEDGLSINIPQEKLHLVARELNSKDEVYETLSKMVEDDYIFEEKANARTSQILSLLKEGDLEPNVRVLVHLLKTHSKRPLSQYEDRFLKRTKNCVLGELCHVFSVDMNGAKKIINSYLNLSE